MKAEPATDNSRWKCATCGTEFAIYDDARRHAARRGHRRIDWQPR